jgi:hypothetical protein
VISFQASRVQIPLAPMKTGSYCGIGEEVLLILFVYQCKSDSYIIFFIKAPAMLQNYSHRLFQFPCLTV